MTEIVLVSASVEAHLKNLLEELHVSDYSLKFSPGAIKGDNYLGIIAAAEIIGKTSGKPVTLHLIVKSAPQNELLRQVFPLRDAFQREIYMYTEVLPTFTKFQEEKRIPHPFNAFPKFYTSTMDEMNEALIMENVKVQGFALWNRFKPIDLNHARLVLQTYGKLHAVSFALKDQQPELFQKLAEHTREIVLVKERESAPNREQYKRIFSVGIGVFDRENDNEEEICDKLTELENGFYDKICKAVEAQNSGEYAVIGHGDCWINNLLFKYDNPEEPTTPTEICLIDFQLSRYASPVIDLAYFIFTCTDKELRDKHYHNLLKDYHNTLCESVRQLGSDPEKLFPYEVLEGHLRKFCIYGLFASLAVLQFMTSEAEDIPDMSSFKNLDDLNNFTFVSKNMDTYRSRIKGVVMDFIKYNYDV